MSKSENVLLGLVAIAALLYFGMKAKADSGSGGGVFVPGGADGPFHGVTGSWLTLQNPLL